MAPQDEQAQSDVQKPNSETSGFFFDAKPKIVKLPDSDNLSDINVKYDLIPPFSSVHIFWNEEKSRLIYFLQEPELSDDEKRLFRLIKLGLQEMISTSFVTLSKKNMLKEYLEKNVKIIILELNADIDDDMYRRLMYFVYRDFVGLGKIESLMKDFYVEDIECNGFKTPLYVIHRKYGTVETNIIFNELPELSEFIEKIAQRCNRYVSFSKPMLDGTLPDGSRVNATYSSDISTRGPTFTIRKFTEEPLTPVNLMKFKMANAEIYAYVWFALEHQMNAMVVGETASGKTTFMNSAIFFLPPQARLVTIEDTRELNLDHENWLPSVAREGFGTGTHGHKYGEITLFDLLKESFRQNPEYIIVGEVRGAETYVLFQGMASGHPSMGTFHAGSMEMLLRRLESDPINIAPALIQSLDLVLLAAKMESGGEIKRRLTNVFELEKVHQEMGKADYNLAFKWTPAKDEFNKLDIENSLVVKKIMERTGLSYDKVVKELDQRKKVLQALVDKDVKNYKDFSKIIAIYYANPKLVLKKLGIEEE